MPIVSTGPFPVAGDISFRLRALVNDMITDTDGDVLADDQPGTFPLINSAYEVFQDALIDGGSDSAYRAETVITGLTGVSTVDPNAQVELSFTGFFDGTNTTASPALPAGLVEPERIWERPSGSTGTAFLPLEGPCDDGLPQSCPGTRLRFFEWRGNSIYFCAASQSNDIRLRYLTYAPAITDATSSVAILRAVEPVAQLAAYKFALSRGSAAAATFKTDAQTAIDQIVNREIKSKQRKSSRRRAYGHGSRGRRF